MKKIVCSVGLLLILSSSSIMAFDACGSVFGNLSTAESLGMGQGRFAGGIGIADATSFHGAFVYGMSQYIDGRLKLGAASNNGETYFTLGADMKYQIWSADDYANHPFDLAIGGLFEHISFNGAGLSEIGIFGLGSYPMELTNGHKLSPYGRLNIRIESSESNSELEFGLHGGVCYEATEFINLYGEIQIDGNEGIFFGLDYRAL
ncbi:MAG: hypothetical protein U9N55_03360 [candidate division Zixibacteria bacterium]|nr:hypothetical protein [candidate division Zixibacteria bacterium]